nr:hypothetical protein GCM10020093_018160 [Planobispora longispora]
MRLVAAVRAELGREVSVEDVYAARTFGGLSALVERAPHAAGETPPTGSPAALSPPSAGCGSWSGWRPARRRTPSRWPSASAARWTRRRCAAR